MYYSDLPKNCKGCLNLKVTAAYVNGEYDYTCYKFDCKTRPKLKVRMSEAEKKRRK